MAEPVEEADVGGPDLAASGSDGLAAALIAALGRRGDGGKADPEFEAFLKEQSDLVRIQKEHLHEQRQVILSNLKLRRINEWMKAALQALTMLVGVAVVVAIAIMAWQAHEDHGLVVQQFSVPPDLAQRGLTGEVIASRLIDGVSQLQAQTDSTRPASSYANNWGDDLKVEIPETGVSIGELDRWLRKALGHETIISGEVYRTPTGIAVAARAGVATARVHTGSDADLDELLRQTAQDVYAATQPYRYAVYLAQSGQAGPAKAAMQKLARTGDLTDRLWAYDGLATTLRRAGDDAGAIRAASSSIAIDPRFPTPHLVRGDVLAEIGHDEASLADLTRADALLRRDGRRYLSQNGLAIALAGNDSDLAAETGDFGKAARLVKAWVAAAPAARADRFRFGLAYFQARWHDVAGARATENELLGGASATADVKAPVEALADAAAGDSPVLLRAYAAVDPAKMGKPGPARFASELLSNAALARAKTGDVAAARALIGTTPLDCYPCVAARGRIEAVAHDWAGADRWFAEAVRQGPSLPFAYADWAEALLSRGDAVGAIAKLELAHQKGPHFADPLELWGEALMAKRDNDAAIKEFAEADKDAPRWGRNHLRWGEALMLSGKYAEARAQYQIANGLDLSVGDRAALNVLLARTSKGPLHG